MGGGKGEQKVFQAEGTTCAKKASHSRFLMVQAEDLEHPYHNHNFTKKRTFFKGSLFLCV